MRGYHVYKDIWEANVGEELECVRERRNEKDSSRCEKPYHHRALAQNDIESLFVVFKKRRQLMLYSNWSEKNFNPYAVYLLGIRATFLLFRATYRFLYYFVCLCNRS